MFFRLLIIAWTVVAITADLSVSGLVSVSGNVAVGESPAPVYDEDAQDLFDRVVTAGSDYSATQKLAVNNLALKIKGSNEWSVNYWAKMREIYPKGGTNLTAAREKLKYLATNSPTLAITGMVETNYVETRGIKGTANRYLSTGVNFNDFGNGGGLSVFLNENDVNSPPNGFLIGTSLTSPPATILWNISGNISYGLGNNAATPYGTKLFASALYRVARRATNVAVFQVGGVNVATNSTVTSGTRDTVITILAGSGTTSATNWVSFAAIDDGTLTDTESLAFARAVYEFNREMGRTTPAPYPANLILSYGQSTSIGLSGGVALTTFNTNQNRMMDTYRPTPAGTATHYTGSLPLLIPFGVEDHQHGFAALLSAYWKSLYPGSETNSAIFKSFGVNATAYAGLAKGTVPYSNMISTVETTVDLAQNLYSGGARVTAVLLKHGEADNLNANYKANLITLRGDIEDDVTAITGQTNDVVMIMTQSSTWGKQGTTTNLSAFAMLDAYTNDPVRFVVSHARHMMIHGDGLHPTNTAYRWDGEMGVKAYVTNCLLGGVWKALIMTNVVRTNAEVYVTMPSGTDIKRDGIVVTDPNGTDAFEWWDNGGPSVTIVSVAPFGSAPTNRLKITLSGTPSGGGEELRVGYTTTAGSDGGPTTGPRTIWYRDENTFTSLHGNNMADYMLHQRVVVPYSYNFP